MRRRTATVLAVALLAVGGCSASGSRHLTCNSTEVAPNSQPGSNGPKAALDWFVKHADAGVPRNGYELTSHSATRYVYSSDTTQVSVTALPGDKGKPRLWVVTMTYDCT